CSGEHCERCVDPTGRGHEQECPGDHHPRVDQDLLGDVLRCGHDWQHRHPGSFVVVGVLHRHGPGVWWGPEEHHTEHHEGGPAHRAVHGSPADHHRHAACRTTPDHVLRRAAFEYQ